MTSPPPAPARCSLRTVGLCPLSPPYLLLEVTSPTSPTSLPRPQEQQNRWPVYGPAPLAIRAISGKLLSPRASVSSSVSGEAPGGTGIRGSKCSVKVSSRVPGCPCPAPHPLLVSGREDSPLARVAPSSTQRADRGLCRAWRSQGAGPRHCRGAQNLMRGPKHGWGV